jgi:phosphoglycolate phosphatase-like HAD superfamily hydrolase
LFYEITGHMDMKPDEAESRRQTFFATFFTLLERRLRAADITVYPGVHQLLEKLAAMPHATLALLTGNTQPTAGLKLSLAGIFHYFRFGAYGNEGRSRSDLPAIAVERAREHTGRSFVNKDIVIIGDTPNDIECGRHLSARTIAVATGTVPFGVLQRHQPDHLFHDFSETGNVLRAIME